MLMYFAQRPDQARDKTPQPELPAAAVSDCSLSLLFTASPVFPVGSASGDGLASCASDPAAAADAVFDSSLLAVAAAAAAAGFFFTFFAPAAAFGVASAGSNPSVASIY